VAKRWLYLIRDVEPSNLAPGHGHLFDGFSEGLDGVSQCQRHAFSDRAWHLVLVDPGATANGWDDWLFACSCDRKLSVKNCPPFRLFLIVVGVFDFAACGSANGGNSGSGGGTQVPTCVNQIFQNDDPLSGCGTAAVCHGGPNGDGAVDLTSPGVIGRLLDAPATHPGLPACPKGDKLIDTANKAQSFLLKKVANTQSQDCGVGMPYGSMLTGADLACFETWVNRF
jgi:hypothetical protein